MFIADRSAAASKPFAKAGPYNVKIVKSSNEMTTKGEQKIVLTLRADDGSQCNEMFLNRESVWWKLNMILAAADVSIKDGEGFDLTKSSEFERFFIPFIGQCVNIELVEESYVKDGETKVTLRVKRYNKPVAEAF